MSNLEPTSELGTMVNGLRQIVELQADTQKRQIDANAAGERDRLELERERTILQAEHLGQISRQQFVLQCSAVILVAGVVIGGFLTGSISIVTHALTAVLGMIAGIGLSRRK